MSDLQKTIIPERRYVKTEARMDGEGRLEGHAAVFDKPTVIYGFEETVYRGAFTKTIQEQDIRGLFNHDVNFVLGRNRAGTLELSQDSVGLHFRAKLPETTWANDLAVSVKRGDINQGSFKFWPVKEDWGNRDGMTTRALIEVGLFDVSLVTFPAYKETNVGLRTAVDILVGLRSLPMYDPQQIDAALSALSGIEVRGRNFANLVSNLIANHDDEETAVFERLAHEVGVTVAALRNIVAGQANVIDVFDNSPHQRLMAMAGVLNSDVGDLINALDRDGCEVMETEPGRAAHSVAIAKRRIEILSLM